MGCGDSTDIGRQLAKTEAHTSCTMHAQHLLKTRIHIMLRLRRSAQLLGQEGARGYWRARAAGEWGLTPAAEAGELIHTRRPATAGSPSALPLLLSLLLPLLLLKQPPLRRLPLPPPPVEILKLGARLAGPLLQKLPARCKVQQPVRVYVARPCAIRPGHTAPWLPAAILTDGHAMAG